MLRAKALRARATSVVQASVVLASVALACVWPAALALASPATLATDRYLESQMQLQKIPGLSLGVFRHGRPIYVKGYGVATLEHAVAVKPRTRFQIGSIGKQFTAVAILLLAREHRLDLDDPLQKFLPEIPTSWQAVSLRRMLNHQSGIAQLNDSEHALLDLHREYSDAQLVHLATSQPLDFAPGTDSAYSDTAYVLLGIVINRITHGFYGDFLGDRIFKPLGMTRTQIISESAVLQDRASGYEQAADGSLQNQAWVSATLNRTADGSLYSTVLDLGRWDAALYTDTILPRSVLERMWTIDRTNDGRPPLYHYGYGWEINSLRDQRVIEYDGNWQGFQAAMARYPSRELTVVVLTNRALCRTQQLAHDVAGFFDAHLRPYRQAARDAHPALTRSFARWLETSPDAALVRELKSVGPIRRVALVEERPAAAPGAVRVYRVELAQMVDTFTVHYSTDGTVTAVDLDREF